MILVLISANSEWRAVRAVYPQVTASVSLYGETFETEIDGHPVTFLQGGVGKIAAAASTEYAIGRFQPQIVVNLGTCGGFAGCVQPGEVILAEETLVYDIIEQMSDPAAAIARYTTRLDLSWLPASLPLPVRRARLLSADRDIVHSQVPELIEHYGGIAADWESGAIAWVCAHHKLPCLILRVVTDLVSPTTGEAYGNIEVFHNRTAEFMPRLIAALPRFLPEGIKKDA